MMNSKKRLDFWREESQITWLWSSFWSLAISYYTFLTKSCHSDMEDKMQRLKQNWK